MVSDHLLEFAAKNYGFDVSTLCFVSDSTNQIYIFNMEGKPYILRFSQRPVTCINQTKAEMDWLYYLASNHVNVSLPLKASNDSLVITTEEDGKHYIITAFETASGQFWDKNDPNRWNEKIFYNWGKVMGDIHRLTKDYKPSSASEVRGTFTGKEALSDSIKTCPSVNKIAEDLVSKIMSLPKDKDSYGLIHYDVHPWNFYIDGDKINVFDFDDSLYGWFALDIGVALYHALWWGRPDDVGKANAFIPVIIESFLKGYLSSNHLDDFWFSKIPLFMKFRQICKFSWFFNPDNIDDEQKTRIYNIENDILFSACKIDKLLFAADTYSI